MTTKQHEKQEQQTSVLQEQEEDIRWCMNGDGRYGEYGVIDAEQADETYMDDRLNCGDSCVDDENDEQAIRLVTQQHVKIQFANSKLYGRENEIQKLILLYESMMDSSIKNECNRSEEESVPFTTNCSTSQTSNVPRTVFISGFSGCGKSSLVKRFVEQIMESNENQIRQEQQAVTTTDCRRKSNDVLFLRTKYELNQQSTPYSAFTGLFDHTIPLHLRMEFQNIYTKLQESLGDDTVILTRIFPKLRYLFHGSRTASTRSDLVNVDDAVSVASSDTACAATNSIVGTTTTTTPLSTKESVRRDNINKSRLQFAISTLFRILCCHNHSHSRPVILFIDDLQWADDSGLELIQNLIMDETIQSLLLIGAYRSNEINECHQLTRMIMTLQEKKILHETIHLAEINQQATCEFIADSLRLSPKEVLPLTKAIFSKTLGNPLFIRQALEHLIRKNALYYDTMIFSWNWNLGSDSKKTNGCHSCSPTTTQFLEDLLTEDIVEMVKLKIENMNIRGLKRTLAIAAYIRSTFDTETLLDVMLSMDEMGQKQREQPQEQRLVYLDIRVNNNFTNKSEMFKNDESSTFLQEKGKLKNWLQEAVEEGLLLPIDPVGRDHSNPAYCFSHDRIQEAAKCFLGDNEEKDITLLNLGSALLRRAQLSEFGEDWMYFVAAQHFNSVSLTHPMMDKITKTKLAELNCYAAQLSMYLLAFTNAVEYIEFGIADLFSSYKDMWISQFDLCLKLHSLGAQAYVGDGNLDEAEKYCDLILRKTCDIEQALPAYKVRLDILARRGEFEPALELNLFVLEELGVKFPKTMCGQKIKAWVTLQRIKAGQIPTEEKIKKMPHVSDPKAADIMELIRTAVRYAFSEHPQLYMMLCCENVRWMNRYGLTDVSGSSMASFANVVTHKFGDFKTGQKLAQLAILIVDCQNNKYNETQAINTANQNVLGWVTPIKSRMSYHTRAYESGMLSGNFEGACVGKWFMYWTLYHSGSHLSILAEDLRIMLPKAKKMGFHFFATFFSIMLQLVQNLMGDSENTTTLIGKTMDERDDIYSKMPFKLILPVFRSYAYVVFNEYEKGAQDALERGHVYNQKFYGMQYGMEPFYRGICCYVMARRKTNDRRYKKSAMEVRKQYQIWVKKGCINLVGLLQLLDAEHAALYGKKKLACKKFEQAIARLSDDGFYNNAAVACERYGYYLNDEHQRPQLLRSKLLQALDFYNKWGAKRKVELLTKQIENL